VKSQASMEGGTKQISRQFYAINEAKIGDINL